MLALKGCFFRLRRRSGRFLFLKTIAQKEDEVKEEDRGLADDRLRACEEGRCFDSDDREREVGLLQRYLEDQLSLAGVVYECGDDFDCDFGVVAGPSSMIGAPFWLDQSKIQKSSTCCPSFQITKSNSEPNKGQEMNSSTVSLSLNPFADKMAGSDSSGAATLPQLDNTVGAALDYRGQLASRFSTGQWKSALFIIGVEVAERFAYYGIASNLITYLTGPLGRSTAVAAENVNAWDGVASLLPLLGALIADSYLGRYRTIIVASLLYILGLGLLTLSAFLTSLSAAISEPQLVLFFLSLYLVAIAQGGHKPCVQAFGADQFDADDPIESEEKSSFFNWWYFGLCGGATVTMLVVVYIQDNLNWSLGFGIPCIAMVVALAVFLMGTRTYRFSALRAGRKRPFVRISQVRINI
ncbi:hypothetical protein SAY86_003666 [Trapa natans]|uniref:Uncharacterized protein n=1 Tax=Trapa natans TaxID=22666 RepID=A0AAN7MEL9_TRANT|nr:hypothetical protein SAY86_003666 [Trapa natans]